MKKITAIYLSLMLIAALFSPFLVNAQTSAGDPNLINQQQNNLGTIGVKSGYGPYEAVTDTMLSQKIGQIISYILAFLGVIFLVIVVFSGITWMTAGGNEDKVSKARTRLINATIGLAIVMAAYAMTWFVVNKLQSTISSSTPGTGGCSSLTVANCDPTHCAVSNNSCIPSTICIQRFAQDCAYGNGSGCSVPGLSCHVNNSTCSCVPNN